MATAPLPATDVGGMSRPAGRLDAATALDPYAGPWTPRLAAHLLRRAGFGADAAGIAAAASTGMHAAVDALIAFPAQAAPAPPAIYDPRPAMREAFLEARGNDMERRELFKSIRKHERRSIIAMQHWWLNRMLTSPAPLQERMTLFFHGHFTTAAIQKGVTPQMAFDQNTLFRTNALGNLRELTWSVSHDPAMLIYLDNARNEAKHPNENYARELMELFTLGVDHYTEQDVREASRAWTGWMVNRRTGKARFVPARHDEGSKTFLGQTGNWNGRDVVEIIYRQPACSEFWAAALLNHFVYNSPEPALVESLAALIRKNDFNLEPVMSTLLRSNVFYSPRAYRALVKSPAEFVVGTYKTLQLPAVDLRAQRALAQMGQILFFPPNVAGWPGGANWITTQTAIARDNFVTSLVNSAPDAGAAWMQHLSQSGPKAAAQIVQLVLQGDASPAAAAQLAAYLDGSGTAALGALSPENDQERIRGAACLTMAMPAYQLS